MQCCADKPTWGCILQLFATFEPWRRHLRRVTSAKGSQKSEFYMLAFDWLEQTDKIGCNIFPAIARMTCAELWCQIVWEHFPQHCAKLDPYRSHLRSKNVAKVSPKSWFWMQACWSEQTLKIYIQYSTYFACNNGLCSAVLTNLLGDVFLNFLPHLSLEEGIWEV